MSGRVSLRAPSLTTIVRRALEGECRLGPGTRVLVAVSGGPDSMALLSSLIRVGPRFGLALAAHGVDHGLRAEAAAELDLAAAFAAKHGVPFGRTTVEVEKGGNLQARARSARWAALVAAAASAPGTTIATAHHSEDRAETVLMRMLRGSGARGLAVLPARASTDTAPVVRPLLRATRSDVMAHLERHAVPFAHDPSNVNPRFLRTKVRQQLLPLLCELDPGIVSHLCAIADDLATAETLRGEAWTAGLPRPTQTAIAALMRSRSKEARVWLPGGLVAMVESDPKRTSRGSSG